MTTFFSGMIRADSPESFGRFSCFLIIICLLVWSSSIVVDKGIIPELPDEWVYLILTLYGVSKGADAVQGIFRGRNANPGA